MIAKDVIDRARIVLDDLDEGNRAWPDDVLLRYLDDADRRLRDKRPDLYLMGASVSGPSVPTSLSSLLAVDDGAREILVDMIVAAALRQHGADEENLTRAEYHEKLVSARTGN